MADNFCVSKLEWDSTFFSKNIGHLNFVDEGANCSSSLMNFELVQAKVFSENYEKIDTLNRFGFLLAEGEMDFSMQLAEKGLNDLSGIKLAGMADNDQIRAIVENNFTMSRYRQPWFKANERDSFYQLWAEKAIRGTFDDACLIVKKGAVIKGFITIKVANSIARIGLISVASNFKQQGVGKSLLHMAVQYCQMHNVKQLLVATQLANTAAISLYSKFGFSINTLSYWFYKTHDPI